jgi:hypothetical protein
MRTIDEFFEDPLLGPEAAEAFRRAATRLAARHRGWRADFPSFALLLDRDEERARALAGNHATEARQTIGVWLAAQEDARSPGRTIENLDEKADWIDGYWAAWRIQVMAAAEVASLDESSRTCFARMFDELMQRYRDEAVAYLRTGPAASTGEGGFAALLWRPVRAFGRGLRGFFFPGRVG